MSVSFTTQDHVAIITLDDGNKNVINHDVLDALERAFDQATGSNAKAIVFKGRPGSFCAGYDLAVMTGDDPQASARLGRRGGALARRIYASPIPIVGLAQGHAFTIGLVWLACCDLCIGEEGTFKFGMTEVALNVPLTGWALEPMRAKVKPTHHLQALLHSTVYDPVGAASAGLLDRVVAAGTGEADAMASAQALSKLPAHSYQITKQALRETVLQAMDAGLD